MQLLIDKIKLHKYKIFISSILLLMLASIYSIWPIIYIFFIGALVLFVYDPKYYIWFIVSIWPFTFLHGQFNEFIKISGVILFLILLIKKKRQIKFYKFQAALSIFIIVSIISVVVSFFFLGNVANVVAVAKTHAISIIAIKNLFQYVYILSLVIIVINYFKSQDEIIRLLKVFIIMGTVVSLFSLILYFLDSKGIRSLSLI